MAIYEMIPPAKQSGIAVVLPAYNPGKELEMLAEELIGLGFRKLVVVDDGSSPGEKERFGRLNLLPECTILTHDKNLGKGVALKTAFHFCMQDSDITGVVTADSDGQHSAEDIYAVAAALLASNGETMILGRRDIENDADSPMRKTGNRLTTWAFQLIYGVKLADTQTGLRAYPAQLLERLISVRGSRFEYEINILIRMARENIPFKEVPVQTILHDGRESSFHIIWDSLRVFGVLILGFLTFALSSASSAITDVTAFYLLEKYLFANFPPALSILWASAIARVISSMINYTINRKLVFAHQGTFSKSAWRYYALWIAQFSVSYGLVYLAQTFIRLPVVILKAIIDLSISVVGYQVQLRWVFKNEKIG